MTDNLEEKNIQNASGLFQMIREKIIDVNGNVIAVSKYYIPIEKAVLKVYSSN